MSSANLFYYIIWCFFSLYLFLRLHEYLSDRSDSIDLIEHERRQTLINQSDMLCVRLNGLYFKDTDNKKLDRVRSKALERAFRRYEKFEIIF